MKYPLQANFCQCFLLSSFTSFFLDTEALAFILVFICFFREYALHSIQNVAFDDY